MSQSTCEKPTDFVLDFASQKISTQEEKVCDNVIAYTLEFLNWKCRVIKCFVLYKSIHHLHFQLVAM